MINEKKQMNEEKRGGRNKKQINEKHI